MSSESESKDSGHGVAGDSIRWHIVTLLVLGGCILGLFVSALRTSFQDQVVLSRSVYNELLHALEHIPAPPDFPEPLFPEQAAQKVPTALRGAQVETLPGPTSCDIEHIQLGFDPRFGPKSEELRLKLEHRAYPTFEELYFLVVNRPYDSVNNIWSTFPNAYNMKPTFHFPFSNLRDAHVEQVLQVLGRPPKLALEVGSFHGHSAILQAQVLDKHGFSDVPLLCIDPWIGDLGMLLFRDDWDKKLTPGELADGRSTSYFQFMLNVRQQIADRKIGPKHIIPLASTSIVGARFLMVVGLTPDFIYLDSAHEADETFTELTLYYHVLARGGIIYGDDFSWDGVQHDVKRFALMKDLQLTTDGVTWLLQKPADR